MLVLAALVFAAFQPAVDNDFVGYDDPDYVTANGMVQRGLTWQTFAWAFTTTAAANWHPLTWLSHLLDVSFYGLNPPGYHLTSILLHTLSTVLLFAVLRVMTGAAGRSFFVAALFGLHPLRVESVAWVAERKDVLSTAFWFLTLLLYAQYVRRRQSSSAVVPDAERTQPTDQLLTSNRPMVAAEVTRRTGMRTGELRLLASVATVLGFKARNFTREIVTPSHSPADGQKAGNEPEEGRSGPNRRYVGLAYAATLLCFACGLMAKPMLVTLPFVLLLLDFWPLQRFGRRTIAALVLEKLPFFALSFVASVITFAVQRGAGAMDETMTLGYRVSNVTIAYVRYLGKIFWPTDLVFFYPQPPHWPGVYFAGAVILLLGISTLAVCMRRRQPWLLMGWCWFLGTLVPVIGLVQVGSQSIADRYSYLPSVGILVALVWGVAALTAAHRQLERVLAVAGVLAALACFALTRQQVRVWKSTELLCRHAIAVTTNNYLAHDMLGATLEKQGRNDEARREHLRALEIKPDYADAHNNLGVAYQHQGESAAAAEQYQIALRLRPRYPQAHFNLGVVLADHGQLENAIAEYSRALAEKPDYPDAHYNLGLALARLGRLDQAVAQFQLALRLNPRLADAHNNLGVAFDRLGRPDLAVGEYQQAIALQPEYPRAHFNLGVALTKVGQLPAAASEFEEALRLKPDYAEARTNLEATRAALRLPANPGGRP